MERKCDHNCTLRSYLSESKEFQLLKDFFMDNGQESSRMKKKRRISNTIQNQFDALTNKKADSSKSTRGLQLRR